MHDTPFLVLETGHPPLRRHGRFPYWIRVAAGLPVDGVRAVDVSDGEALPAHGGWAGVIVSGSPAMVTERRDWSERTATWLREAIDARLPVLGICYGHQLLAHALGGEVGDNPNGREMGTVAIRLGDAASSDPLFMAMPATFRVQATHLQSVLRLPDGATRLAQSALDDCQAFRYGDAAWGVQFHPEFSTTHMREYVRLRADALRREGRCPQSVSRSIAAAPRARDVLRRFVRFARHHRRDSNGGHEHGQ